MAMPTRFLNVGRRRWLAGAAGLLQGQPISKETTQVWGRPTRCALSNLGQKHQGIPTASGIGR